VIRFTILGQAASKANSRKIVDVPDGKGGKRRLFAKSKEALTFEREALRQIPPAARQRIDGPVRVTLRIWYATERPDLDESLVLDVLQDRWVRPKLPMGGTGERMLGQAGVYRNDRQVREKHVFHGIDRKNPRVEVLVEPMQAQQPDLLTDAGPPKRRSAHDLEGVPF
jgi:hypothetical protein